MGKLGPEKKSGQSRNPDNQDLNNQGPNNQGPNNWGFDCTLLSLVDQHKQCIQINYVSLCIQRECYNQ